jgi:single-strand DNA-binding protein
MASIGVNKVILIGNLGKDPEVRRLDSGTAVANFPLATTEVFKDKNGQKVEQTEWHNIVLWRGQAEFAEKNLKKGYTVYIEGKLRTRSWEDKDKNKRYATEVVADSISIVRYNNRVETDNTNGSHQEAVYSADSNGNGNGDLPF